MRKSIKNKKKVKINQLNLSGKEKLILIIHFVFIILFISIFFNPIKLFKASNDYIDYTIMDGRCRSLDGCDELRCKLENQQVYSDEYIFKIKSYYKDFCEIELK